MASDQGKGRALPALLRTTVRRTALTPEKILVTGGGGMLARDLAPMLRSAGFEVEAPPHARLDLAQPEHVRAVLATYRPAIVVNTAAFTKVDLCESDPRAEAINDRAVQHLARACERFHARLMHVSTDFVFDGTKRAPYTEDDATNPLSTYGRTKKAGEAHVLAHADNLVVRTSWLFGSHGPNFVEAMLRQAEEGKTSVRVVDDQIGRPTATADLASAMLRLLDIKASGLVHFANSGEVTWNGFAREIFSQAGFESIDVMPITSAELNRPAVRPAYSVLSTEKYENLTGEKPRDFRVPLAEYLARRRRRIVETAG